MDKAEDPLLRWFYGRSKTERSGSLQRFDRAEAGVYTYSFRYRYEKIKKSKAFYLNPRHAEDLSIAQTAIQKIEQEIRLAKRAQLLGLKVPTVVEKKESALTLLELLKWHLEEILKLGRSKYTALGYELAVKKFIEFVGGENVLVSSLRLKQLYDFYSFARNNGAAIISATIWCRAIRYMFAHAKRKQIISETPFADYRDEVVPRSPPRDLLTIAEMRQIGRMIRDSQIRDRRKVWLAWQIIRFTGIDAATTRRLLYENIDHENRALRFARLKRRRDPWITIPIHWKLAKILLKYKGRTGKIFSFGDTTAGDRRLIHSFNYFITKLKGRSFKRKGPHTLRHSFNHILEQYDVRFEYQCYLLGHTIDRGGEHRVYMHPWSSEIFKKLRDTVDALPL